MADSIGSARQEAERLVATVLAMAAQSGLGGAGRGDGSGTSGLGALGETVAGVVAQLTGAAGGHRGDPGRGWATGSAECCVCPVCRMIAGLRDPSPHTAARLATGAGDLATGVASVMRAFSALSGDRSRTTRKARPAPPPPDPETAWSAATRGPGGRAPEPQTPPDETTSPWAAATRAPAPEHQAPVRERQAPPPENQAPAREHEAPAPEDQAPAPEGGESDRDAAPWAAATRPPAAAEAEDHRTTADRGTSGAVPGSDRPGGVDHGPSAAAPDPRISSVSDPIRAAPGDEAGATAEPGSHRAAKAGTEKAPDAESRPRTGRGQNRDVWAAATADPEFPGVAVPPAVDHEDAGDGHDR